MSSPRLRQTSGFRQSCNAAPLLALVVGLAVAACQEATLVEGYPERFAGVGLELRIEQEHPVVVRSLAGGPAADAGLQAGDRIMEVDGESTAGKSLGNVVMLLRGKPNTQISLAVERDGKRILVVVRRRSMRKAGKTYQPE